MSLAGMYVELTLRIPLALSIVHTWLIMEFACSGCTCRKCWKLLDPKPSMVGRSGAGPAGAGSDTVIGAGAQSDPTGGALHGVRPVRPSGTGAGGRASKQGRDVRECQPAIVVPLSLRPEVSDLTCLLCGFGSVSGFFFGSPRDAACAECCGGQRPTSEGRSEVEENGAWAGKAVEVVPVRWNRPWLRQLPESLPGGRWFVRKIVSSLVFRPPLSWCSCRW